MLTVKRSRTPMAHMTNHVNRVKVDTRHGVSPVRGGSASLSPPRPGESRPWLQPQEAPSLCKELFGLLSQYRHILLNEDWSSLIIGDLPLVEGIPQLVVHL